jgi:Alpha-L-arabinofuranosidase B, catalytic
LGLSLLLKSKNKIPTPPFNSVILRAGYSLRRLRTAYTGSCVRVRRSSDNTELNIGFTDNVINSQALLTFVGSGNGFVQTWYDQSGNGFNVTQNVQAQQLKLVSNGVISTCNGLPAIIATNTTFIGNITFNQGQQLSFIGIAQIDNPALGTQQSIVDGSTTYSFGSISGAVTANFGTALTGSAITPNTLYSYGVTANSGSSSVYLNNLQTTGNAGTGTITNLFINRSSGTGSIVSGFILEVILVSGSMPTRPAIFAEQKTFYKL